MSSYDAETEAKLDEWVAAKRRRDFVTSDAIQAELEAQGVDTKAARPDPRKSSQSAMWGGSFGGKGMGGGKGGGKGGCGGGGQYDAETEAKLDEWVTAKRARDFVTSDAIQAELEAQGVDTKTARPDPRKAGANAWGGCGGGGGAWGGGMGGGMGGCGGGGQYDADTEARLDEWVAAKRARDFVTSDAIQAELEAQGIDTKAARPDPRKAGGCGGGGGAWGGGGGGGNGFGGNGMENMMTGMMSMMKGMMKGQGGKGFGKGGWSPY